MVTKLVDVVNMTSSLEIVVEHLDLYDIFGRYHNIPKELCMIIESYRNKYIKECYDTFTDIVNFKCVYCTTYVPAKLIRTARAIVNQANAKHPKVPKISHILLMNDTLYEYLDYLNYLMDKLNRPPKTILWHI